MKTKKGYYDQEIAIQFGIDSAILIEYLSFWISTNRKRGKNFKDGNYWMFISCADLSKELPFWKPKKIQRLLSALVKKGVINRARYNRRKSDRTYWYCFFNEEKYLREIKNNKIQAFNSAVTDTNDLSDNLNSNNVRTKIDRPISQNDQALPSTSTSKEPSVLPSTIEKAFCDAWGRKIYPKERDAMNQLVDLYGEAGVLYGLEQAVVYSVLKIQYVSTVAKNHTNNKTNINRTKVIKKTENVKSLLTFFCQNIDCGEPFRVSKTALENAVVNNGKFTCKKCNQQYLATFVIENISS